MQYKDLLKKTALYSAVFVTTVFICVILLVLVAMIPPKAIKPNVEKSAEWFCERDDYYQIFSTQYQSRIDHYADSIWVSIAYSYNPKAPLKAVMLSKYYTEGMELGDATDYLFKQIKTGAKPNEQYLRYWHGGNIVLKPFLIVGNIEGLYKLNTVILVYAFLINCTL